MYPDHQKPYWENQTIDTARQLKQFEQTYNIPKSPQQPGESWATYSER